MINVSTITPVYSGREYLPELVRQIEALRNRWLASDGPLRLEEAIFVNDDSGDGSLELLYHLQASRPWIQIVNLSRNFGQHQATIAGILHSSGDWVVTLDEDLQHEPRHIETLLRTAVNRQMDVVYANPETTVHRGFFRDWASRGYKWLLALLAANKNIRMFNSFRLIRGSIARASAAVSSHGTYYDIALCWFTGRLGSIELPLRDIRHSETGKSGYSFRKLLSHARKLIISSQTKVVRLGASIGLFAMLVSSILGSKILYDKLVSPESIPVQGWTSLFLVILFFSGLLAVLSGIILEYMSVILLHIQGKPTYFAVNRRSDQELLEYFRRLDHDSAEN